MFSSAKWISASYAGGADTPAPCPFLRKSFRLEKALKSAVLHITALGLYEAEINGRRVGDQVFAPGWTNYEKRVVFQSYDVTGLLRSGENVVGAVLGDGWYCGHVAWKGRRVYGDRPLLLAALEIRYEDGTGETIATGSDWEYASGPISQSDFLMGEDYDARLELDGWSSPGNAREGWNPAVENAPDPSPEVVGQVGPAVRRIEEISPKTTVERKGWMSRALICDMGQNFTGRIRIRVKAHRGCLLRFRYAEILNPDGSPYTENLRTARSTDYYTCKGAEEEVWEPKFTFHGFRYVEAEVSGLNEGETLDVTGVVLHSDMAPTGKFRCSNEMLNRLQHNIVWGQKSNFLEVPTDCPQRDERLGWTGDAQVFIRTASFNMDTRAFFHKWMQDARDAQGVEGWIPAVIPNREFLGGILDGGPAWSDATVICPWTIYLCFGDRKILEDHYDSMKRWIAYLESQASIGLIRSHPDLDIFLGFGDWLALDGSGKTEGCTPKDLIGTAFFAHVTHIVSEIAVLLGRGEDAARFAGLHKNIVEAFRSRYVTPAGQLVSATQTALVLAIHFGLLPEGLEAIAAENLVRDIKEKNYHIATGFVGTPYILQALEKTGHLDIAYRLLEQETFPSWIFPIHQGATTIWERWDGWTPEKGFQDKWMNSFNHYAYGAVGAWMYATVAGLDLDPADPGYSTIVFRPRPGGTLEWAEASLQTDRGEISIRWEKSGGELKVVARVPDGARGVFSPPPGYDFEEIELAPGTHSLDGRAKA